MRRAAKADGNQHQIVKALKAIGAKVYYIKEPVDLLVGYRGKNSLLEVKDIHGRLTKAQEEFMQTWPGQAWIVQSVDQALEAIIGKEHLK